MDCTGQNTGVPGSHSLLQGIFPTQGSDPGLMHCGQILYHLSHQGCMASKQRFKREDSRKLGKAFFSLHLSVYKCVQNTVPPSPEPSPQEDQQIFRLYKKIKGNILETQLNHLAHSTYLLMKFICLFYKIVFCMPLQVFILNHINGLCFLSLLSMPPNSKSSCQLSVLSYALVREQGCLFTRYWVPSPLSAVITSVQDCWQQMVHMTGYRGGCTLKGTWLQCACLPLHDLVLQEERCPFLPKTPFLLAFPSHFNCSSSSFSSNPEPSSTHWALVCDFIWLLFLFCHELRMGECDWWERRRRQMTISVAAAAWCLCPAPEDCLPPKGEPLGREGGPASLAAESVMVTVKGDVGQPAEPPSHLWSFCHHRIEHKSTFQNLNCNKTLFKLSWSNNFSKNTNLFLIFITSL